MVHNLVIYTYSTIKTLTNITLGAIYDNSFIFVVFFETYVRKKKQNQEFLKLLTSA